MRCPSSTQNGKTSSYKAVIEADESESLAVEELAPLHRGLLVIVSPEVGNPTESAPLRRRQSRAGRLSVDLVVDPSVDQPVSRRLTRRSKRARPRIPATRIPLRISLPVLVHSCATSG